MMFRYQFEKGPRKYTCPACGKPRRFRRVIDVETGDYLADNVGKCDRENSCGYTYMAKDFLNENGGGGEHPALAMRPIVGLPRGYDYHDTAEIERITRENADKPNTLATFLYLLYPERRAAVASILRSYRVGTFENKYRIFCMFPYIDSRGRTARAKLIVFDPATGKRSKERYSTSSLRHELGLRADWNYDNRVFFGEHLLAVTSETPVCIVEAEKSAILGAIEFPEAIWLATGTKGSLSVDKIKRVSGGRPVILVPDGDAIEHWAEIAADCIDHGVEIRILDAILSLNETDRKAGTDIADLIIRSRTLVKS